MLRFNVDIRIGAFEPHQKPVLPLTAIFALPDPPDHIVRQIIEMLIAAAGQHIDQISADPSLLK